MAQEIFKLERMTKDGLEVIFSQDFGTRKEAIAKLAEMMTNDEDAELEDFAIIYREATELEILANKVLAIVNSNDQGDAWFNLNTAGDIATINRNSRHLPLCSSTLRSIVELMEQNNDFSWWVDSNCNVNISQKINY